MGGGSGRRVRRGSWLQDPDTAQTWGPVPLPCSHTATQRRCWSPAGLRAGDSNQAFGPPVQVRLPPILALTPA